MKLIILLFLSLSANPLFPQLSGNLGLGYNRFTNNYNYYQRTNGLTLQLAMEKELTKLFSLNYGLNISVAHENYIDFYYETTLDRETGDLIINYNKISSDKSNNYSLSFQYPVILVTKIIQDKLFMTSGISINIDNYRIFGDAFAEWDPEFGNPPKTPKDFYVKYLPIKALGFGHNIGIIYKPTKKIGFYIEWKTTKNKSFSFSYIETGIKYMITNRQHQIPEQ